MAPAPRVRDRHLHDRRRRSSTRTPTAAAALITDGATQWMTAGAGILHIETPPEALVMSGGLFHGIQLWVNLPAKDKIIAPALPEPSRASRWRCSPRADGGALVRLIAGDVGGHAGPGLDPHADHLRPRHDRRRARGCGCRGGPTSTRSSTSSPARARVGAERRPIAGGQLAVLRRRRPPDDRAPTSGRTRSSPTLEVLVLGGRPIREPVAHVRPVRDEHPAELVQAIEDYQAGRLGVIPPNALMPHVPRE